MGTTAGRRGRFGNRWLALAVTIAGIVATMPYIALQLVIDKLPAEPQVKD